MFFNGDQLHWRISLSTGRHREQSDAIQTWGLRLQLSLDRVAVARDDSSPTAFAVYPEAPRSGLEERSRDRDPKCDTL
jgi:hypothetical protein